MNREDVFTSIGAVLLIVLVGWLECHWQMEQTRRIRKLEAQVEELQARPAVLVTNTVQIVETVVNMDPLQEWRQ